MKRLLSIAVMLSAAAHLGAAPLAVLDQQESADSQEIGHAYVFSAKGQQISLRFLQTGKYSAKLYAETHSVLAATEQTLSFESRAGQRTTLTLDLPSTKQPAHYRLVFDTPEKPYIRLTSLPTNYLAGIKQISAESPLVLLDPPAEFTTALQQHGIRYQTDTKADKDTEWLISFRDGERLTSEARRQILISTSLELYGEVWTRLDDQRWKVTVPASKFTRGMLQSAASHAYFAKLLQRTPINH